MLGCINGQVLLKSSVRLLFTFCLGSARVLTYCKLVLSLQYLRFFANLNHYTSIRILYQLGTPSYEYDIDINS